jgi:hypothetical protein
MAREGRKGEPMTANQALYLAREARQTVYSLGRAYDKAVGPLGPLRGWQFVPLTEQSRRLLQALGKANARWARREAKLNALLTDARD